MIVTVDGRYIQDHFPGIGRYTYNLVGALARVAPEQSFVVLYNPALQNTRFNIDALKHYGNVEICRVDVPTLSVVEQYRLQPAISRRPSTLFHSPYFVKPYALRVPSVVTIFDLIPMLYPRDLPRPGARMLFRVAVSLAARTSARVIVASQSARDDLTSLLNIQRAKIAVIPLAAEARFAPQSATEVARVREKYRLPPGYILVVGINKPHKNLGTLIEAWHRADLDASLTIAGAWDTRYASTLVAEPATRGGRSAAVRFIHNIDDADLPALYTGAMMFVAPSFYEGFGLAPLEAMACGAPVLCANASSLPEVVGGAALMFDPHDVDGLARALARVAADPGLRAELRTRSLARAKEFSWEYTARETLQVYRTVMGEK